MSHLSDGTQRGLKPTILRRYPGQRALHIVVRTGHIAAAGLTLGAATFGADPGRWPLLAALSGSLLVADDVYRYGGNWLRYVQSWVILGKLGVLVYAGAHPALLAPALWLALIAGSLISHAPGAVRHHALWGEAGPCAAHGCGTAVGNPSVPGPQAQFPRSLR